MSFIVRREGKLGDEGNEVNGRFGITNLALYHAMDLAEKNGWSGKAIPSDQWPNINYNIWDLKDFKEGLRKGLKEEDGYYNYLNRFIDWLDTVEEETVWAFQ